MGVIFSAHPVRGESHIQRNVNGEVATPVRKFKSAAGDSACVTQGSLRNKLSLKALAHTFSI